MIKKYVISYIQLDCHLNMNGKLVQKIQNKYLNYLETY